MERCERFLDLISQSLDNELTEQERQTLDEHLCQCPDCRALLTQLSQIHNEFSAFEEQEVPEGFTQGVMERIRTFENSKKIIPLWKRPQVRAIGSLAACAALCVGLLQSGIIPSAQESASLPSPAAAPAEYSVPQAKAAADGTAAFSLERGISMAEAEEASAAQAPMAVDELSDTSALPAAGGDMPYTYPITPEDPEWAELSTEEKQELCQIPEDILSGMSTSALVETVLDHPYLIGLYAWDNLDTGIEQMAQGFNGMEELLAREDAAVCLQAWLDSQHSHNTQYGVAEALIEYIESNS